MPNKWIKLNTKQIHLIRSFPPLSPSFEVFGRQKGELSMRLYFKELELVFVMVNDSYIHGFK
jgi:hypothetical protein